MGDDSCSLVMECYTEELSEVQLAAYEKAESEYKEIRSKLDKVKHRGENIFAGNIFSAYQLTGLVTGLESYTKTPNEIRTKNRKIVSNLKAQAKNAKATAEAKNNESDKLENIPLSKRKAQSKNTSPKVAKAQKNSPGSSSREPIVQKPCESNTVGGLIIGRLGQGWEDTDHILIGDTNEVQFSKSHGKTFPSLAVSVKTNNKGREMSKKDRSALDNKVKICLLYTPAKFTEWLIQSGLVRTDQCCPDHSGQALKLGMYSDVSKFAYSGGYVWISDCCGMFVSVFSGSIFEGCGQPPSVLLKLIYHWACQTSVQNVLQWVKVDNLYVKRFYTWLRSICTISLYNHFSLMGGPTKRIEVGVISLGTSSVDGTRRQVKVEVLGVLDTVSKVMRLRAIDPASFKEKLHKKRFLKILEPLVDWVHEESIICTDSTVDKVVLRSYGFRNVVLGNSEIMDYLRRVVPRMFQNTLSLLTLPIIQQFLDELVWRESYGFASNKAFENIIGHIADQTKINTKESVVLRLSKVAANPFKDWSYLSAKVATPATLIAPQNIKSEPPTSPPRKRPPSPVEKSVPPKRPKGRPRKTEPIDEPFHIEPFYYGVCMSSLGSVHPNDSCVELPFEVKCPQCTRTFVTNTELQDHLFEHVSEDNAKYQCRYCLKRCEYHDSLIKHIANQHPIEVSPDAASFHDLICEMKFTSAKALSSHMTKHVPAELPYRCAANCGYLSSSRRLTIDHFYEEHGRTAILQCPLCLHMFVCANREKGPLTGNVSAFLKHMIQHWNKQELQYCDHCSLVFVNKASARVHIWLEHGSRSSLAQEIKPIGKASTVIPRPKVKGTSSPAMSTQGHNKNHFTIIEPIGDQVTLDIPNGQLCLECGQDFDQNMHIVGVLQCEKCKEYQTNCLYNCVQHNATCNNNRSESSSEVNTLGRDYHCICGYGTANGNAMASHMVACDRKSVYVSLEEACANTVKQNMLDMLGLMRNCEAEEQVYADVSDMGVEPDATTLELEYESQVNIKREESVTKEDTEMIEEESVSDNAAVTDGLEGSQQTVVKLQIDQEHQIDTTDPAQLREEYQEILGPSHVHEYDNINQYSEVEPEVGKIEVSYEEGLQHGQD